MLACPRQVRQPRIVRHLAHGVASGGLHDILGVHTMNTKNTRKPTLAALIEQAANATDTVTAADALTAIVTALPHNAAPPEAARNALQTGIARLATAEAEPDGTLLADARDLRDTLADVRCRLEWLDTLAATIESTLTNPGCLNEAAAMYRARTLAGLAMYLAEDSEGIATATLESVPASKLWPKVGAA